MPIPAAYFITYRTYGTWLHGRAEGWVDPAHNQYGTEIPSRDDRLLARDESNLAHAPFVMTIPQVRVVDGAIRSVCAFKQWSVHALNVRTTHVHIVVSAECEPEVLMNSLKSWSTRRLREAGIVGPEDRLWARHGSTRYLWNAEDLQPAIRYVLLEQGEPLV